MTKYEMLRESNKWKDSLSFMGVGMIDQTTLKPCVPLCGLFYLGVFELTLFTLKFQWHNKLVSEPKLKISEKQKITEHIIWRQRILVEGEVNCSLVGYDTKNGIS